MPSLYETELVLLDVETTGFTPPEARLVELAARVVQPQPDGCRTLDEYHALLDPGVDVPASAAAVHGLTRGYLRKHATPLGTALSRVVNMGQGRPLVAHNARFDRDFLAAALLETHGPASAELILNPARWLCTLRLARLLRPDLTGHALPALFYAFNPEPEQRPTFHRADADVLVLQNVLDHLLEAYVTSIGDPDQGVPFVAFRDFARTVPTRFPMPTGKHRGVPLHQLPFPYLEWVERSGAFDGELRESLLAVLFEQRGA